MRFAGVRAVSMHCIYAGAEELGERVQRMCLSVFSMYLCFSSLRTTLAAHGENREKKDAFAEPEQKAF